MRIDALANRDIRHLGLAHAPQKILPDRIVTAFIQDADRSDQQNAAAAAAASGTRPTGARAEVPDPPLMISPHDFDRRTGSVTPARAWMRLRRRAWTSSRRARQAAHPERCSSTANTSTGSAHSPSAYGLAVSRHLYTSWATSPSNHGMQNSLQQLARPEETRLDRPHGAFEHFRDLAIRPSLEPRKMTHRIDI